MNVLVSYSRPRGKYGRYIFTVMIYFAHPTETATIEVNRPQTETQTKTIYGCDHCGRWATITTHQTVTVNTPLRPAAYQKDGKIDLYRYDNVEPDDFMELVLRDFDLLKYQMTRVKIGWDDVSTESYWRYGKFDQLRTELNDNEKDEEVYYKITGKLASWRASSGYIYFHEEYEKWRVERHNRRAQLLREETRMNKELIYPVNLLNWDEYVDTRSEEMGDLRIEEELIRQTMNAEQITITDLVLEPLAEPLAIEGSKHFIEGQLKYLE